MNENYTHITVVVDRSGSMVSMKEGTIKGFNEFLKGQKEVPGKATISYIQFDDQYEEVYIGKDLKDAPELNNETFVPRGSTALLDALGRTINKTGEWLRNIPEAIRPGKVVFVIITDGYENASHEFKRQQVFDMIKTQTDIYKWGFVYLGANQDAIQEGATYYIPKSGSWTYSATDDGVKKGLFGASMMVSCLRTSSKSAAEYIQTEGFKDENREPVKNLKR